MSEKLGIIDSFLRNFSKEFIVIIIIPGMFLTTILINFYKPEFVITEKIILFLPLSISLGWITHYIALFLGSKFIKYYKEISKTENFLFKIFSFVFGKIEEKEGEVPEKMIIYRNFFANLALNLPFLLWFFFDKYLIFILPILLWFALSIYVQCENSKSKKKVKENINPDYEAKIFKVKSDK